METETIGEAPEWDPDYDYQDYNTKHWQDGLRLGIKGQNLVMRMSSDFEFNTKAHCNQKNKRSRASYFGFDSGWKTVDVEVLTFKKRANLFLNLRMS